MPLLRNNRLSIRIACQDVKTFVACEMGVCNGVERLVMSALSGTVTVKDKVINSPRMFSFINLIAFS